MENLKTPSDVTPQAPKAALAWQRMVLWGVSVILLISGSVLTQNAARDGWWNEVVAGLLTMAGAIALLPPVLDRLRSNWPILKPRWTAAVFALSLLFVPNLLGKPFAPGPAKRAALRLEAIQEASALLKAGKPSQAKLALRRFANDPKPDRQIVTLIEKISAASETGSTRAETPSLGSAHSGQKARLPDVAPDPAKDYVERVQTYWLPETASLPTKAPSGGSSEYGSLLSKLEALRSYVADGEALSLSVEQGSVHRRFRQAVAAKQSALYPSFRENYADALRAGLFRDDIDVAATGPRASILKLTGGVFARNANIEDMQRSLGSAAERMRFKKVEYRWSPYVRDGYQYELDPKQDGDVRE